MLNWIQEQIDSGYTNGENEIKHNHDQCLPSMLTGNAALRHLMQTSNVKYADRGLQQMA
jgi:hypothetical protein